MSAYESVKATKKCNDSLTVHDKICLRREQPLLMLGGGPQDISELVVNFSWPLILSKYFFMAPPFRYNTFS
jgi:hypothetical protein